MSESQSSFIIFFVAVLWMTIVTFLEFRPEDDQVKNKRSPFSPRTSTILTRIFLVLIQIIGWGLVLLFSYAWLLPHSDWLLSLQLIPENFAEDSSWAEVFIMVMCYSMMLFFVLIGKIFWLKPHTITRPLNRLLKKKDSVVR